jgi:hypothetical protein
MKKLLAIVLLMVSCVAMSQTATQKGRIDIDCEASHALARGTRQPAPSDCGQIAAKSGALQSQMSGAVSAPDERFTAAIMYVEDDQKEYICTGVLLDDQHILTAGHCGCGKSSSYRVTFNQFARSATPMSEPLQIDGGPILFDPLTCLRGPKPGNDLALIRLKEHADKDKNGLGIDMSGFGYPAFALAADVREQMQPRVGLKVVGFGETETGDIAVRMKASIPVLTPDCLEPPYNLYCEPFLEMILAEREGARVPRDTCGGDSGGPVFVTMPVSLPACTGQIADPTPGRVVAPASKISPQSQDVLVAITSRAAPFTQPLAGGHCGGGGIYTILGRRSVYAWLDANHVMPQKCVVQVQ